VRRLLAPTAVQGGISRKAAADIGAMDRQRLRNRAFKLVWPPRMQPSLERKLAGRLRRYLRF
jgi:hypothetical protein